MFTGLSIQILGRLRGGHFSPCSVQPCSFFQADRVAIGSRAWSYPALVLPDSTVSPRHALVEQGTHGWVLRDLESDNGIRAFSTAPAAETPSEAGRLASHFEFHDELCCCIGAVVLRLKSVE